MRTRLFIFSADHRPLMALDIHGDVACADRTLQQNRVLLRSQGFDDVIVLSVDPLSDADTHVQHVHGVARLRLETRTLPDGTTEIHDLHCLPPDAESTGQTTLRQRAAVPARVARAIRIVHAPDHVAGARRPIRRTEDA